MKAAIYARFSSDNQRDASIEDQIRLCREKADREGWTVVQCYTDHAVSGASLMRPGIQALIADGARANFDIIVSEALDRLSRDQEDIAGIYKRMSFADVKIVTLSEGRIDNLHIGLKGTMNALFLKDLADKTRRGLRGRIENGKSGGGNCYGYNVVKKIDGNGDALRGEREINPQEARIVQRIFRDYAGGKSPQAIAVQLNKEGIPSPMKNGWGPSTVHGNRKRGTGILNNELYIGRLVWNRLRYVKDPDTGKRVSRPRDESEVVVKEVPDLRIVEQNLWDEVKARQGAVKRNTRPVQMGNALGANKRPKYLLSGIVKCGHCGAGYIVKNKRQLICAAYQAKKTCDNKVRIDRAELEQWVLEEFRNKLMTKEALDEFCRAYTQYVNQSRMAQTASLAGARQELQRIEAQTRNIIEAIKNGLGDFAGVKEEMLALEARKTILSEQLEATKEPKTFLHPSMAKRYREKLSALYEVLNSESKRARAAEAIRTLMEKIVVMAKDDKFYIEVVGDLGAMINFALDKKPASANPVKSTTYKFAQSGVSVGCGGPQPAQIESHIPRRRSMGSSVQLDAVGGSDLAIILDRI